MEKDIVGIKRPDAGKYHEEEYEELNRSDVHGLIVTHFRHFGLGKNARTPHVAKARHDVGLVGRLFFGALRGGDKVSNQFSAFENFNCFAFVEPTRNAAKVAAEV